jgi:hypothetical protein
VKFFCLFPISPINFSSSNISAHASTTAYKKGMLTKLLQFCWCCYHCGHRRLTCVPNGRALNAHIDSLWFLPLAITTPTAVVKKADCRSNTSKRGSSNAREVCSVTLCMFCKMKQSNAFQPSCFDQGSNNGVLGLPPSAIAHM